MQLDKIFKDINVGDIKILCGDLTVKVGSVIKDWEKVIGPHGIGEYIE